MITAELARIDVAHVDWHGHADGALRGTPAPIHYREGGEVFLAGPRTPERLAELLRVHALRDPAGGVHDVADLEIEQGRTWSGTLAKSWRAYRFATPYWPTDVAAHRCPRQPYRSAWAGRCVAGSIQRLLEDWAAPTEGLHVQVEDCRGVEVAWARPARGVEERAQGFTCVAIANVALPYFGLGKHAAEGFGRLGSVE
jgi:hypothetical protein